VAPVRLTPGTHLALSMIPVGGATKRHPALFIIKSKNGKPPVAIYSTTTPAPPTTVGPVTQTQSSGTTTTTSSTPSAPASGPSSTSDATAFPFQLPAAPGPGGTQALALNTTNGGVKYDVAYSLVTVTNGAPVTNTNSAFALAHCQACTTVAVSFQVVLVIGQSNNIAPINAAGALNYDCPACTTTALADQIVVTLKSQPSAAVVAQLEQALKQLNALPALGANGTPAAVSSEVATVQQQVETVLNQSGLVANPPSSSSTSSSQSGGSTSTTTTSTSTTSGGSSSSSTGSSSTGSSSSTTTTPSSTTGSSSSTTSSSTPTTTTSTTSTTPATGSG
jgi:putative peptide zinc metalloprotease protein